MSAAYTDAGMADATEEAIRLACEEGRYKDGAALVVESYGPEILGFLVAWMGNRELAREAFAVFSEDLCVGLPRFGWRCTARGWAYTLARNAGRRQAKAAHRDGARRTGMPTRTGAELAARVSTQTRRYLRTDFKDGFRRLRARLPIEDDELLILRIDRQLPWRDLAVVLGDPEGRLSPAQLEREAARLRKHFQVVKERLREMARAEGLIE